MCAVHLSQSKLCHCLNCNAIIIYLHIFYLCLLRLLFFSPPVTFYRPPATLSRPFARASVHYNVKNTQEAGGGGEGGVFSFITKAKSPEEAVMRLRQN